MINKIVKKLLSALTMMVAILSTFALPQTVFGAETQYFPVASSRVGPYSAMGTGYYGAQIDYMNYVNMNGGVNGVMLTWQECETEYNAVKTVECYQRLFEKDGQRIVVFDTLGTPGAYAVINRMAKDNVVLAQYGYGRTDGNEMWSQFRIQSGGLFAQLYTVANDGGEGKTPTFLYKRGSLFPCVMGSPPVLSQVKVVSSKYS